MKKVHDSSANRAKEVAAAQGCMSLTGIRAVRSQQPLDVYDSVELANPISTVA